MAASSGSPPSRAQRRSRFGCLVLGLSACMPSKSLEDYGREFGSGGNAAGSGGAAGAAGAGGGTAGSGGRTQSPPDPPGREDAGTVVDAGDPPRDAGAIVTLDGGLPAALCAADEVLGPDERCYFFDATLATWATARAACQARGTNWDLARVRLAAQSVFLGETLAFEAWIGATDAANEGQWLWVGDVSPFWIGGSTGSANGGAYTNWNATEPNGATTTNCARALPRSLAGPTSNAPWADLDCSVTLGVVCESGPIP